MSTAEALATLILEKGPAVVLSGAGMSTESGIPDFRSPGGLWEQVDPYEVASIDAFRKDPLRVWSWYGPRVTMLASAVPNPGHLALSELERDGYVRTVATQNHDALHHRAGSSDVVELHGSIRRFDCLACGAVASLGMVLTQLREDLVLMCAACDSILKPGVVMFGEQLPERAMARAEALCRETGLLVVLGSSLEVWPVAGLPGETVRTGGKLAIVNLGETSYDGDAGLLVREPVAVVLEQVARILASGSGSRSQVVL